MKFWNKIVSFTITGTIAASMLVATPFDAQAENNKLEWDIKPTYFCKKQDESIPIMKEVNYFEQVMKQDGLKAKNEDAVNDLKKGCENPDDVSETVAKAFNKIMANRDTYLEKNKRSIHEELFKASGDGYKGAIKRDIKEQPKKSVDDKKISLPAEFKISNEEMKNSGLCKAKVNSPEYEKYMTLAKSLGDGTGTALDDRNISQEFIWPNIKNLCNNKEINIEGINGDNKAWLEKLMRNLQMSVQIIAQQEKADEALKQLKENVKNGKGTGGIPIEGAFFTNTPIEEVIKNGGVGVRYDTEYDNKTHNITVNGKPIEETLTALSNHVLSSGNLTVYPGYSNRLEVLFNPKNVNKNDFDNFSAVLDEKITMNSSESFMGYSDGKLDQADAAVRATIEKPQNISDNDWNGDIKKKYSESPYRMTFLEGGYKELGKEKDSNVYSIIKGQAPEFFLLKKNADKWLKDNNLDADIKKDDSAADWSAKVFGYKDKWEGYGMSLSSIITDKANTKGMTLLTDKTSNGDNLNLSLDKMRDKAVQNFTTAHLSSKVANFALKKSSRFVGPKAMQISDNAFTGALFIDQEDRKIMQSALKNGDVYKAAVDQGNKLGSNALTKWNLRNAYIRSARNSMLSEMGAKGAFGKNINNISAKTSSMILNSEKLSNIALLRNSALTKSAGYQAGKEIAEKAAAKKIAELGLKQGGLKALSMVIGSLGGPVGWVVTAVLLAIDVLWNWDDYSKMAVALTRSIAYKFGKDLYPDPTESEIKDANLAAVMYGNYGLVDMKNGKDYVKYSLENDTWVSQAVVPKIENKIAKQ